VVIRKMVKHLLLMILLAAVGCESVDNQPTIAPAGGDVIPVTAAPTLTVAPLATRALNVVPTALPSATSTPLAAASPESTALSIQPMTLVITPTVYSLEPTAESLQPTAYSLQPFIFGTSVEGRELRGIRIGDGARILMLVGAVHGGFETNTSALIEQLATHFGDHPGDLLPDVSLILIPSLNPDGVARGRVLEGRFNANAVDLNRNWDCGWEPVAYFRDQTVGAGDAPFSEPETAALSVLIQSMQPSAVLFYHAAADGVFAGDCGGDSGSAALSEAYGRAAEYGYADGFSRYPVTGTGPAWVNSIGIPSADVELASATDPEFDRNLRGVMAVQWWLIGR
jgi:hypothetical protein